MDCRRIASSDASCRCLLYTYTNVGIYVLPLPPPLRIYQQLVLKKKAGIYTNVDGIYVSPAYFRAAAARASAALEYMRLNFL